MILSCAPLNYKVRPNKTNPVKEKKPEKEKKVEKEKPLKITKTKSKIKLEPIVVRLNGYETDNSEDETDIEIEI
ncbi:hypothetical protein TVAG_170250 [Trichomonas vaginalis G3]|uniref:Uncharacterized protein n=1 Tax=Trichomonas vaginalis (strain ATCC PRA-98 / G3) TaxID=412133 RepID=A2DPG7_TRIV3|nr:hypothetical protein TVAG_170250 [Trichomonas vaginalis G3]|eukprot:XP_001329846.1 hypothetical protein [Trichomonas vaginalis G3]